MRIRRIVGLVLLLGIVTWLVPMDGEAGVWDADGPGGLVSRLFDRIVHWVEDAASAVVSFVTTEGASPDPNG